MQNVNIQFIISTVIIMIGYLIKKFNIITEKDGEVLAKLILNVTMPALIISSTGTVKFNFSLGLIPLIAFSYGLFMAVIAIFLFRKQTGDNRAMMTMLVPGFSVALFAYPFVEGILGKAALNYAAMFDMGNSLITLGIDYLIACYFISQGSDFSIKNVLRRAVKSIPLTVYMFALFISIINFRFQGTIMTIFQTVSKANMPLCFLAMGIYLNFKMEHCNRNTIKILAVRYLIGLAAGFLLYYILPLKLIYREIILICLVMPLPISMLAYAVQFKFDKRFVGMVINISNIISYLLLWGVFNFIR